MLLSDATYDYTHIDYENGSVISEFAQIIVYAIDDTPRSKVIKILESMGYVQS